MSRNRRLLFVLAGVGLAVGLFFVFRPDREEPPAPRAETAVATTTIETTIGETASTVETTAAAGAGPRRVEISVEGGLPVGGIRRFEIERGRRVVFVVRSDVADRVHVHGYDLKQDVAPGDPARISFRAKLAGTFEIELEDRRQPLARLRVTP